MATFAAPRVQITEVDISEFVQNYPTSVGALAVTSRRGSLTPKFITSTRKFKELYCYTPYKLDRDKVELLAGLHCLEKGVSGLWISRAIANDAKFSAIGINKAGALSSTVDVGGLTLTTDKQNPVSPTWSTYPDTLFVLYAENPGVWGNNLKVTLTNINSTDAVFNLKVTETLTDGSIVTRFEGTVSLVPGKVDGYGSSIYIVDVLEENEYVKVLLNPNANLILMPSEIDIPVAFVEGTDGSAIADGDLIYAMQLFNNKELYDIDILIQGGIGGVSYQTALVSIAEQRSDCIAVLDVPEQVDTVDEIQTYRKSTLTVSSSYATLFAPWLKVYDYDNDITRFAPPSGMVAGMLAETGYEYDPWWVPAGLKRGVVEVLGLKAYYTQGERDVLDPLGINLFVRKPGVIALWGNRTTQLIESALSFFEVRRLLNYVKKNVLKTIESFLFDPLTDRTRLRIVASLDDFLRDIKARGGLYDYSIKSDKVGDPQGNNPPASIDQGRLNLDIYLKPTRAIRYISLNLVVTRTGAQLNEAIV